MDNSIEARITPKLLIWAREISKLTLKEVSEKTEIPLESLLEWENGNSYPTFDQLLKIAELYSMPVRLFYLSELRKEDS